MSHPIDSPTPVRANEPLARFIFSSSHFSRESERVKPSAFLPAHDLQSSVTRTDTLTELQTWQIGEGIAAGRPATLHGRADLLVSDVHKASLTVEPAEPPPNHANIGGWPSEKSEQKLRAIELAQAATLHLKPT